MRKVIRKISIIFLVVCALFLVACTNVPSNAEQAKVKLNRMGYSVFVKEWTEEERLDDETVATVVCIGENFTATLFKDKKSAQERYDTLKIMAEDFNHEVDFEVVGRWVLEGNKTIRDNFKK